jgi:5-methylcytosine-specific restriction protein A
VENADYQTAVRLALKSSTELQKAIATAFLEEPHRFLHKELAARLEIAPLTLSGDFGKLGHRVYEILQWHPEGWQAPEFDWSSVLVHFEKSDDGWLWIARNEFLDALDSIFMDEVETGGIEPETFSEGGISQRNATIFERSRKAREACLEQFGARCFICQFDFGERYGSSFSGNIHVHHVVPISSRRAAYQLDPKRDLRPVCPNCHCVLHLKNPPYSVEEVRHFIRNS